jgi:hypothetical protein
MVRLLSSRGRMSIDRAVGVFRMRIGAPRRACSGFAEQRPRLIEGRCALQPVLKL